MPTEQHHLTGCRVSRKAPKGHSGVCRSLPPKQSLASSGLWPTAPRYKSGTAVLASQGAQNSLLPPLADRPPWVSPHSAHPPSSPQLLSHAWFILASGNALPDTTMAAPCPSDLHATAPPQMALLVHLAAIVSRAIVYFIHMPPDTVNLVFI